MKTVIYGRPRPAYLTVINFTILVSSCIFALLVDFSEVIVIVENLSNKEYRDRQEVSKSDLDLINRSIAHWVYRKENPVTGKHFDVGSCLHDSILSPNEMHRYVVEPSIVKNGKAWEMSGYQFKTKTEAQEAFESSVDKSQVVLSEKEMSSVHCMKNALMNNRIFENIMKGAKYEVSFFSEIDGIGVKCRPDIFRDDQILVDLKTTDNASFENFTKSIANYRYHVQAAWYLNIVTLVTGIHYDTFIFAVVEKTPPYGVALYDLSKESIDAGRELYKKDLEKYKRYLELKTITCYEETIQNIELPAWAMKGIIA